jgi:hypothetical protein
MCNGMDYIEVNRFCQYIGEIPALWSGRRGRIVLYNEGELE